MPQTRVNKAVTPVNSDAYNLTADLATLADSLNVPIPVATQAERDALVSPTAGKTAVARADLGGLVEVWNGSYWTRGVQHAEFTGSTGPTINTQWGPGPLTYDSSNSENGSTFTSPANDKIALPGAGVYSIHIRFLSSVNVSGTTWAAIVNDGNTVTYTSADIQAGVASGAVTLPNFRAGSAQNIRFIWYSSGTATGYTLTSRVRIDRIG